VIIFSAIVGLGVWHYQIDAEKKRTVDNSPVLQKVVVRLETAPVGSILVLKNESLYVINDSKNNVLQLTFLMGYQSVERKPYVIAPKVEKIVAPEDKEHADLAQQFILQTGKNE
jgi:hypothetical protein